MGAESSLHADDSVKYWNEAWLDQLIEEAFRLAQAKHPSKPAEKK